MKVILQRPQRSLIHAKTHVDLSFNENYSKNSPIQHILSFARLWTMKTTGFVYSPRDKFSLRKHSFFFISAILKHDFTFESMPTTERWDLSPPHSMWGGLLFFWVNQLEVALRESLSLSHNFPSETAQFSWRSESAHSLWKTWGSIIFF